MLVGSWKTDPFVGFVMDAIGGKLPPPNVTERLSKTAVHLAVLLCAVTARPTRTVCGRDTVWLPTVVQAVPLADRYAVIVFPLRMSRTQYGAGAPGEPTDCVTAAWVNRHWKAEDPLGRSSIIAYGEVLDAS